MKKSEKQLGMTGMKQEKSEAYSALNSVDVNRLVFFLGGVRSGTTVVRKMLSTHPLMRDRGEIFNSHNANGYFRFVGEQIKRDPDLIFPENNGKLFMSYLPTQLPKDPAALALIDVKYEHLNLVPDAWQLPFTTPAVLRWIKRSKAKVIHLRRQHFFSVMSNLLAVQTGNYHQPAEGQPGGVKAAEATRPPIVADRGAIQSSMKKRKRTADLIDANFDDAQRLSLDYESVFDADGRFTESTCEKVALFLGLDNQFDRQPALRKVIDRPMSELISNYSDIADLEHATL